MIELHELLKSTKVGRFALERARELEGTVVTIKHILSLHIGYKWQARQFVDLNYTGKLDILLDTLQKQLSRSSSTAWQLETPLLAALEEATRFSRPGSEGKEQNDEADPNSDSVSDSEIEQDFLGSLLTATQAPKRPAGGEITSSNKRCRLGDGPPFSRIDNPDNLMDSGADSIQSPCNDSGIGSDLGIETETMSLNSLEMTASWTEAVPVDTTDMRFPPSPMPGEGFCADSADVGFPPTPVPGEALSLYSGANSPLMDLGALDEILCLSW